MKLTKKVKHNEHILAVINANLPQPVDGLVRCDLKNEDLIVAQRKFLEGCKDFRQVIPYTVLRWQDKFFTYCRASSGGESRLHGKWSIGVGGHIDFADIKIDAFSQIDLEQTLVGATSREVAEEVIIKGNIVNIELMHHMICSSVSDVDCVHLGLVVLVDLDSPEIFANEEALVCVGMKSKEELLMKDGVEGWVIQAIKAISAQ